MAPFASRWQGRRDAAGVRGKRAPPQDFDHETGGRIVNQLEFLSPPGRSMLASLRSWRKCRVSNIDDEIEIEEDDGPNFGEWLSQEMQEQEISIPELAAKTGISYAGIYNIYVGKTLSPRQETREKLAKALKKKIPVKIQKKIDESAAEIPGLVWVDFTPSDLQTIPETGGVYVFYDITDRPVYVGMSKANVRQRVKDHQTRFWFKEPLVVRGAFLAVPDPELCYRIETILIKFLGKHALLNVKGATKDLEG